MVKHTPALAQAAKKEAKRLEKEKREKEASQAAATREKKERVVRCGRACGRPSTAAAAPLQFRCCSAFSVRFLFLFLLI